MDIALVDGRDCAPPPLDFLTAPARRADMGEAQFEASAASMLSLVQRGKFHNQNDSHVTERDAKKVTDLLHTKEAGGLEDLTRSPNETAQPARDKGELLHWSQRLVQLRRKADLPLSMVMRWASEAVEDWKVHLARDLLQACLKHAHQQIERSEAMSLPHEIDDFLKLEAS